MTTYRHRLTVVAFALVAAGLSACASDPTSPLERERVSADTDTTKRTPTLPWTNVTSATPTLPWN